MYYIQYKLNLKQTPLQSIQVPIDFKCPEYRGFTLVILLQLCIPYVYSMTIRVWYIPYVYNDTLH